MRRSRSPSTPSPSKRFCSHGSPPEVERLTRPQVLSEKAADLMDSISNGSPSTFKSALGPEPHDLQRRLAALERKLPEHVLDHVRRRGIKKQFLSMGLELPAGLNLQFDEMKILVQFQHCLKVLALGLDEEAEAETRRARLEKTMPVFYFGSQVRELVVAWTTKDFFKE